MRLASARVQKYRSIRDTGWFDVEQTKTILVGPNEAGKTALLRALQQINPPKGVRRFDVLRDYPRSEYNDITAGRVKPSDVVVVQAKFRLEPEDLEGLPPGYENARYVISRRLDNTATHRIEGGPDPLTYDTTLSKDLSRMAAHADKQHESVIDPKPSERLSALISGWTLNEPVSNENAQELLQWLNEIAPLVDEDNEKEDGRHTNLITELTAVGARGQVLKAIGDRLPVFVLFSNYYRIRPSIHLEHLADRIDDDSLDDAQYDYGNMCLLKFLGFDARDLSKLGMPPDPDPDNPETYEKYTAQLDKRNYQLNAASIKLTQEI